jgi:hypothetical protein
MHYEKTAGRELRLWISAGSHVIEMIWRAWPRARARKSPTLARAYNDEEAN